MQSSNFIICRPKIYFMSLCEKHELTEAKEDNDDKTDSTWSIIVIDFNSLIKHASTAIEDGSENVSTEGM